MKLSLRYSRFIRISAVYDVVVILPFAVPGVAAWYILMLSRAHESLEFSGSVPVFDPLHVFFVNLMGIIALVWAIVRLRNPEPFFGLLDGLGRFLFAAVMLLYWHGYGVTPLVLLNGGAELLWGSALVFGHYWHNRTSK